MTNATEYAIDFLPVANPVPREPMRLTFPPRTAPMVRKLGWFKGSKWWRRNSADWAPSQYNRDRQIASAELQYLRWLAAERGLGDVCDRCKGNGRARSSGFYSEKACPDCSGTGGPGISRARDYLYQQTRELEEAAWRAVEGLQHRLFWHGLRPVVCGAALATIEDYDRFEDNRLAAQAEFETAHAEHAELERELRAEMPPEIGGEDWDAWYDRISEPMRDAEKRLNDAQQKLWQYGGGCGDGFNLHRWSFPGSNRQIYVGIANPRRGYGYVKPDVTIIIPPGRSPSKYELDMLAEAAIAEIGEQSPLALVA